jgi:hypothetical protein
LHIRPKDFARSTVRRRSTATIAVVRALSVEKPGVGYDEPTVSLIESTTNESFVVSGGVFDRLRRTVETELHIDAPLAGLRRATNTEDDLQSVTKPPVTATTQSCRRITHDE